MTLNYHMTMERYLNPNRGVANFIPDCEIFSTGRKNQGPTHHKVGSKPHLALRGSLSKVGPTCLNSRWIARCCILLLRLACFGKLLHITILSTSTERQNYCMRAYLHLPNIKKPTPCRFVAESSQMTMSTLIWSQIN